MEKADVLEMTVHYLRELKRREQKQQGEIPMVKFKLEYVKL